MTKHAAYREKWLQTMDCPRALLQRAEYDALRDAVLKGMQAYTNEQPVNSPQLKLIRAVWSKIAPLQTYPRFGIDVSNIGE